MKTKKVSSINQIKATFGLTFYALKASLRNKSNLFFSLVFPLAFVAVFGVIGNSTTQIHIGVSSDISTSNPIYQTIKSIADQSDSPIKLTQDTDTNLEQQLANTTLDSVIEPGPSANSVTLVTTNADPTGTGSSETFFNGLLGQMNLQAAHLTIPNTFTLTQKEISGRSFSYIDFALPGQIGFSLLSLATFGVAFSFITLRRTLVLKRLNATSVTPFTFVFSQCLSRALQAIVQAAIILLAGIYFFHFHLADGWTSFVNILILSFLGIFCFLGFGIFISNIARDEQSAPTAINLFNLPQLLLSGTFFPIDGMPHWVQVIGNNLPLSFFNNAARKIANDGASLVDVKSYLLGMLVWSIIIYFLAARTYKAE